MTSAQNSLKNNCMWKEGVQDKKCPVALRENWIWHKSEVIFLIWFAATPVALAQGGLSWRQPGHGPAKWGSAPGAGERGGLQDTGDAPCRNRSPCPTAAAGVPWANKLSVLANCERIHRHQAKKSPLDHLFLTEGQIGLSNTFWEPHGGTPRTIKRSTFSARLWYSGKEGQDQCQGFCSKPTLTHYLITLEIQLKCLRFKTWRILPTAMQVR